MSVGLRRPKFGLNAAVRSFIALAIAALPLSAHAADVVAPNLVVDHIATSLGPNSGGLAIGFVFVDSTTILALERAQGHVYRINLPSVGSAPATPGPVVLDLDIIYPGSDTQSEYGPQAIILHPNFATNHYIYIRYDRSPIRGDDTPSDSVVNGPNFSASKPTESVIERYIWDPAANKGDGALTLDCLIASVTLDTRYLHGGPMAFGLDNTLYTIYGDLRHWTPTWVPGHSGMFTSTNVADAQVSWPGTIIRLNDDGTIPANNPFNTGSPKLPRGVEAWFAYGVRNSFGLAIDPATGNLWNTENGETRFDEVNRVPAAFNGGNRWVLGPIKHPMQEGSADDLYQLPGSTYTDPQFSWLDCFGVTGMHFLHGSGLGHSYDDMLLVGCYNVGNLWGFHLNPTRDSFVFTSPELQDKVDDRPTSEADPTGTAMEEVLFGRNFGSLFAGTIAISRGVEPAGTNTAGLPYVLTATGNLYRIRRAADTNADGRVNVADLLAIINNWGRCATPCLADITPPGGDGTVNVSDLLAVINNWG